jgi:flavin-binding protein dodecin
MSDQTYAITHVVGTSKTGTDDAIQNAINTVSKTLRNLDWFEVEEIRGYLGEGEAGSGVSTSR